MKLPVHRFSSRASADSVWSAAARRRFGLFLLTTQLRIKLFSPQDDFTPERPNAGQSAARPAHSKISSTYPNRAGRIIARFGVRRPGAALACFSLPLNCESSSFAPKTISRPRDRTRAKALPGQRTPKLVAHILQIDSVRSKNVEY